LGVQISEKNPTVMHIPMIGQKDVLFIGIGEFPFPGCTLNFHIFHLPC
jgi:hypothetical protein